MTEDEESRAWLISTYTGSAQKQMCEEHLEELTLLLETFGVKSVGKAAVGLRKIDASTYIGKGKLEEMIALADEAGANLIVFDDEITPGQQRNLQKIFQRDVIDRTEVILGVFAQRAQTKEARLQIELAKLQYEAPRLKRLWSHLSRQAGTASSGGGGAYLKGEGEKQIEIDRRILKRKVDQLKGEIQEVRAHRDTQRLARDKAGVPVFAIIGYTNAGKSTLLNALTGANVFVEDKLFATLDTTTRKFTLKNNQDILLIDTVGFIRKLPHQLVAAFKSTLEEAVEADILIHLIDASNPLAEEQAATTYEVLSELNAKNKPIITVLNKIDKAMQPALTNKLRMTYPKNVQISALTKEGFDDLQDVMIRELSKTRRKVDVRIPQSNYALVSEIMREGKLIAQEYDENDVLISAEVPIPLANRLEGYTQTTP